MLLARYSKQELIALCEQEGASWVQQQLEARTLLGKSASPGEIETLNHWLCHQQQMGDLKAKTEQDDGLRAAVTAVTEASNLAAKAQATASKAYALAGVALVIAIAAMVAVVSVF